MSQLSELANIEHIEYREQDENNLCDSNHDLTQFENLLTFTVKIKKNDHDAIMMGFDDVSLSFFNHARSLFIYKNPNKRIFDI